MQVIAVHPLRQLPQVQLLSGVQGTAKTFGVHEDKRTVSDACGCDQRHLLLIIPTIIHYSLQTYRICRHDSYHSKWTGNDIHQTTKRAPQQEAASRNLFLLQNVQPLMKL